MAKKRRPMTTISIRVSDTILADLQERASQEKQTVSGVIRQLIRDYLDGALANDELEAMEARIVATIERAERQRARQRRVADLTLVELDFIRRQVDFHLLKRQAPNEEPTSVLRRSDKIYFDWLQKVFRKRLDLLVGASTEPTVVSDAVRDIGEETLADEAELPEPTPISLTAGDVLAATAARPKASLGDAPTSKEQSPQIDLGSVPAPIRQEAATTGVAAPTRP